MSENQENNNVHQNSSSEANAGSQPEATETLTAIPTEVELLQKEVEKYKNEFLYLRAEFDNYRRHAIKERSDLTKFGNERLLIDILSVMDNFERALQTKVTSENVNVYVKGVEMTAQELRGVLNKFGITEVKSEGVAFDPMIHEALSSEETSEVEPGFVFRVFKKAFKLHDKLIRPAQVVVAKKLSSH